MERITSFTVDHDLLEPGIYLSRVDGDVTTYDLRTRKPNMGDYMDNLTMHSVEHMVAVLKQVLREILAYEGPVYGASPKECGNYRNLDLEAAKIECRRYLDVLESNPNIDFKYREA